MKGLFKRLSQMQSVKYPCVCHEIWIWKLSPSPWNFLHGRLHWWTHRAFFRLEIGLRTKTFQKIWSQ